MKQIFNILFFAGILLGTCSCVDFLDRAPDSEAYTDTDVFTDYEKSQKFIDQLLIPYRYFDDNDICNKENSVDGTHGKRAYGLRERITDNCIANQQYSWVTLNSYRNGNFTNPTDNYWAEGSELRYTTIWKAIRVANLSIANIDLIKNGADSDKAKILGMAYFLRGHFYFMLLQGWGGMPYVTEPLDPESDMDLPRETYTQTARYIAQDFEKAAEYLPMVVPNEEWGRPSKMAAIAYKAKALLWGACPFANPGNDRKLWEDAAIALGQAIDMAEKSGYYQLIDIANFKQLFVDTNSETLKEILFGRAFNNYGLWFAPYFSGIKSTEFGNGAMGAESVTENLAQCFTWNNGEPVDPNTEEYKHHPFTGDGVSHTGRDPRFYQTLLFNGASTPQVAAKGRTVEIWNESYDNKQAAELNVNATYNALNGFTFTGYYNWKLFSAAYVTRANVNIMWNYIRLADLYLYYAEAANRAWGPNTAPSGISGFSLTAVGSLNKIRERAGMPLFDDASPHAWLKVGSVENFERHVRNETRIETCFEEKRFYDLRRWNRMLDADVQTMYGLYIHKTGENSFTYTVTPLPDNLNLKWKDFHYLFRIKPSDTYLGPNFDQNPGW